MDVDWDPDAELQRLEKARERVRQLRSKVKYLRDDVSGSHSGAKIRDPKGSASNAEKLPFPTRDGR